MTKFKAGDTAIKVTYGEQAPQYVVIAEGGEAPTKKHPSRFRANNEAERLARANPGVEFHVAKIKRSIRVGEPMPTVSEFDKQIAARADLKPGIWVRVNERHHEHAGKVGYIDSVGEGSDTSVYVKLWRGGPVLRFSPTSLAVAGRSKEDLETLVEIHHDFISMAATGEETRDFRVADIVIRDSNNRDYEITGIIRRDDTIVFYTARDVLTNNMAELPPGTFKLKLSAEDRVEEQSKADETSRHPFLDLLAALALNSLSRRMAQNQPVAEGGAVSFDARGPTMPVTTGDRVWVIVDQGILGLTPGACVRGIVQDEPHRGYVLVSMQRGDNRWSEPQMVNVTRVYSINDPAAMVEA